MWRLRQSVENYCTTVCKENGFLFEIARGSSHPEVNFCNRIEGKEASFLVTVDVRCSS